MQLWFVVILLLSSAVTNDVDGVAQLVKMSVYDRRTFPGLRHDVQLTGDLRGKLLAVCQPTQSFILSGLINE